MPGSSFLCNQQLCWNTTAFRRRPDNFLQLLSRLQGNLSSAKKPASFVSNTPTVSFAGSDAARKNGVVEDESAKKTKSVTSSAARQPVDLKEENLEAETVPSKTRKPYRSTGAEPDATKTSSNTSSKTPKAPGSDISRAGSVSVLGSNLTPRKPSFEEAPSKNLAGAEATKATMETTDKSLEKPSKNLKPESAVDLVFHWSTGAGWTVNAAK